MEEEEVFNRGEGAAVMEVRLNEKSQITHEQTISIASGPYTE